MSGLALWSYTSMQMIIFTKWFNINLIKNIVALRGRNYDSIQIPGAAISYLSISGQRKTSQKLSMRSVTVLMHPMYSSDLCTETRSVWLVHLSNKIGTTSKNLLLFYAYANMFIKSFTGLENPFKLVPWLFKMFC